MIKIPTRPKNYDKYAIKKNDADCLTYSVLMGEKNEDAFRLFHREYTDSAGKLTAIGRKACKQFFMYARNREYMDAYREELARFVEVGKVAAIDETRKDRALKALLDQAMGLVESGTELDPDTLKTVSEIFKKIGLLKDDAEQEIPPIRYLPERCSQCRYKQFIDEHVASGDIEETEEAHD